MILTLVIVAVLAALALWWIEYLASWGGDPIGWRTANALAIVLAVVIILWRLSCR